MVLVVAATVGAHCWATPISRLTPMPDAIVLGTETVAARSAFPARNLVPQEIVGRLGVSSCRRAGQGGVLRRSFLAPSSDPVPDALAYHSTTTALPINWSWRLPPATPAISR